MGSPWGRAFRTGCWLMLGCSGAVSMAQATSSVPAKSSIQERAVREVVDPSSGARWVVLQDGAHPAGPGRMVLLPKGRSDEGGRLGLEENLQIIHSGDRLVLEEHTSTVEARYEATALDSAMAGSALRVRLKLGGRVTRAVAAAAGKAVVVPRSMSPREGQR